MKAIKRNIVGLLRFIGILFSVFILPRKPEKEVETPDEQDKYESMIGPSKPLIPIETKFCPKCHRPVAQIRHTKQGTEIIQNGKVLVMVGNVTTKVGDKETKGFPIRCPNGHIVRIE